MHSIIASFIMSSTEDHILSWAKTQSSELEPTLGPAEHWSVATRKRAFPCGATFNLAGLHGEAIVLQVSPAAAACVAAEYRHAPDGSCATLPTLLACDDSQGLVAIGQLRPHVPLTTQCEAAATLQHVPGGVVTALMRMQHEAVREPGVLADCAAASILQLAEHVRDTPAAHATLAGVAKAVHAGHASAHGNFQAEIMHVAGPARAPPQSNYVDTAPWIHMGEVKVLPAGLATDAVPALDVAALPEAAASSGSCGVGVDFGTFAGSVLVCRAWAGARAGEAAAGWTHLVEPVYEEDEGTGRRRVVDRTVKRIKAEGFAMHVCQQAAARQQGVQSYCDWLLADAWKRLTAHGVLSLGWADAPAAAGVLRCVYYAAAAHIRAYLQAQRAAGARAISTQSINAAHPDNTLAPSVVESVWATLEHLAAAVLAAAPSVPDTLAAACGRLQHADTRVSIVAVLGEAGMHLPTTAAAVLDNRSEVMGAEGARGWSTALAATPPVLGKAYSALAKAWKAASTAPNAAKTAAAAAAGLSRASIDDAASVGPTWWTVPLPAADKVAKAYVSTATSMRLPVRALSAVTPEGGVTALAGAHGEVRGWPGIPCVKAMFSAGSSSLNAACAISASQAVTERWAPVLVLDGSCPGMMPAAVRAAASGAHSAVLAAGSSSHAGGVLLAPHAVALAGHPVLCAVLGQDTAVCAALVQAATAELEAAAAPAAPPATPEDLPEVALPVPATPLAPAVLAFAPGIASGTWGDWGSVESALACVSMVDAQARTQAVPAIHVQAAEDVRLLEAAQREHGLSAAVDAWVSSTYHAAMEELGLA